jgi:alpha-tubulin suppressor-like RCC1 family protein
MYCWGRGGDGELGNHFFGNREAPFPVAYDYKYQEKLAAGGFHTMAVRSDGVLVVWGRNIEGQLGNGTRNGSPIPIVINP